MWEREKVKAGKENEMRGWSRRREREFEQKTQRKQKENRGGLEKLQGVCQEIFDPNFFITQLPLGYWQTGLSNFKQFIFISL